MVIGQHVAICNLGKAKPLLSRVWEGGGGREGWEGGEDVCEHFRWATCYCRGWNLPKNAKGNLLGEQRCGCELPGSRARPCFCISCPRHEPHPEPAAPAGAVGHPASRRGRAVNPSGSPSAAAGAEVGLLALHGLPRRSAQGAPGTNPSSLWEFPS